VNELAHHEVEAARADARTCLVLDGITKRFPGVVALNDVCFDVRAGEVHALLGENGAGKSTLMKILAGVYKADEGHVLLEGRQCDPASPLEAKRLGIVLVHQELSLVPEMTVAENIFLGSLPRRLGRFVDWTRLEADTNAILARLDIDIGAFDKVSGLSIARKQMVEIARALVFTPKIVVFDEPTASLTEHEKEVLFAIIASLKEQDVGIVYISHRMDEIFQISDRVTVLRDGEFRGTVDTAATSEDEITQMMIGRSLEGTQKAAAGTVGEVLLEVRGLSCEPLFRNVSFALRRGEVVGLSGLVGAGRTEVAETLFGLRGPTAGEILVDGEPVSFANSADAIAAGISLVPESRKEQGLVLGMSCRDNTTLATIDRMTGVGPLLSGAREIETFEKYRQQLQIKTPGWAQAVGNLSGGNQQKIVIAKWLETHPRALILDEPTRGIDVGSKAEIHRLIRELARSGYAILVISSEMPEVIGVCDRILAMYSGQIVREIDAARATEEVLVQAITGQ